MFKTLLAWIVRQTFGSSKSAQKAGEQAIVDAALPAIKQAATNAVTSAIVNHVGLSDDAKTIASGIVADKINSITVKI